MAKFYESWKKLAAQTWCESHGFSEIEIQDMYYDVYIGLVVAYWTCPNCGNISKEVI